VQEITAQREFRGYLDKYNTTKKTVFISYRDALNQITHGSTLLNTVIREIENCGAIVYDGFTRPFELEDDDAADVRARMWMASACIFFAHDEGGAGDFSDNQLIEWGYIYGQGKPWAVIVRSNEVTKLGHFMVPGRAFITYKTLEDAREIKTVSEKVCKTLNRWFPEKNLRLRND